MLVITSIRQFCNTIITAFYSARPKILSFGISFIILAIYWMAHYRQFHYIKHSDRTLVWTNVIFLMATCLLPFSTSLLAEYREVVCHKSSQQISRRKSRSYYQNYI